MGQHQGKETLCRRRTRVRPLLFFPESTESRGEITFHGRYYEWLKKGTQRIPHFTRHKDRRLMLFAGLYDSATLDGELRVCTERKRTADVLVDRTIGASLDLLDRHHRGEHRLCMVARPPARHPHLSRGPLQMARHVHAELGS